VVEVFPLSHQEIARARHADLIREATQERLASLVHEGARGRPRRVGFRALRRATTVRRRPAVRTA